MKLTAAHEGLFKILVQNSFVCTLVYKPLARRKRSYLRRYQKDVVIPSMGAATDDTLPS